MSITLNATVCYRESKEAMFFKEQLGQKLKGCSKTLSVWHTGTGNMRWSHTAITNCLSRREGIVPTEEWIQTQHVSQNFHMVLTEQLTHQRLHTPCQENAGTSHINAKWQRTKASVRAYVAVFSRSWFDATSRAWKKIPFFLPPHSARTTSEGTTVCAPLAQGSWQVSWSHGCYSQKLLSWRRVRIHRWCVWTELTPLYQCAVEMMEISALQQKSSWGISVEQNAKCHDYNHFKELNEQQYKTNKQTKK